VGRDRLASIEAAKAAGATIAVADDAMQHHRLAKDIEILVVDAQYGFGNGRLLPAGPLREPVAGKLNQPRLITLQIGQGGPLNADIQATLGPNGETGWLQQTRWLAFAGIAHPQKFYRTLQEHGASLLHTHDFADHHPYRRQEIEALLHTATTLGAKLITTEKDAVRLPANLRPQIATLPVSLKFDEALLRSKLHALLSA
jgi:tetraacyldisaccharide 4'-kinase